MQTLKKTTKLRSRVNLKSNTTEKPFNALAVARRMGKRGDGEVIILHPEKSGFGYKVIWGLYSDSVSKTDNIGNTKQAVVASNAKVYNTKRACLGALKKLASVFNYSSILGSGIPVYDMKGRKLDLTIKTEYTRIWE